VNENRIPLAPERFPTLFLAAAMLLTGTVLGWFGWNAYKSYHAASMIRERYFRILVDAPATQEMESVARVKKKRPVARGGLRSSVAQSHGTEACAKL
jgi:hypothetical protein